MTSLTKNLTQIQEILLTWNFSDIHDWHDGFIDSIANQHLDKCYEECRNLLIQSGSTTIPASKEDTILEAKNKGLLKTLAEKEAENTEVPL